MPVHALQRGNHQSVRGRGHPEGLIFNIDEPGARREGSGDGGLLSGLPEPPDVDFNWLWKAGNKKIPLVGEAITPASCSKFRTEAPLHKLDYFFRGRAAEQIQIAAEVRPMVERLDHRNR